MKKTKNLLFLGIALVFVISCNQISEFEGIEVGNYNGELAAPLFQSTISLQELLEEIDENTSLLLEPDGKMRLNYRGDVATIVAEDVFEIPPIAGTIIDDTLSKIPFEFDGDIEITYMYFNDGQMVFSFESFHVYDLDVNIKMPQLTKNGEIFQKNISVDYEGSVPVSKLSIFSLRDYELLPSEDSITVIYEAIRASNGQRDTLSNFTAGVLNLKFTYAEGFLGNEIYEVDAGTINLDFFDTWTDSDVFFEDPTISLLVENSFGFPVRSLIEELSIVTIDGTEFPLESAFLEDGIDFDYPALNEAGSSKFTRFDFNKENSNIREAVAAGPSSVTYDIKAETNADISSSTIGFMTDTSFFKVQVEVDLPIWGSVENFGAQDTFDIDFQSFDDLSEVEFKIVADNEIPLEASLQMYFVDTLGIRIDSLFPGPTMIVNSAPIDEAGNATGMTTTTTFAPIPEERFTLIKAGTDLMLAQVIFSTIEQGQQSVWLEAAQSLNLRVGLKGRYKENE